MKVQSVVSVGKTFGGMVMMGMAFLAVAHSASAATFLVNDPTPDVVGPYDTAQWSQIDNNVVGTKHYTNEAAKGSVDDHFDFQLVDSVELATGQLQNTESSSAGSLLKNATWNLWTSDSSYDLVTKIDSFTFSNDTGGQQASFANLNLTPGYYVFELTGNDTAYINKPRGLVYEGQFTVTPVPEPATWAVMLVGFGGMGAAMRSRRKQAAVAA
ncbi:MAG TPA: FxDxF family PEP-CTERM protein [Caulobacteraceae bacterium]|nr:FxDxF family PEP-CTERM protein [Caulobacteraceae bacterium]